MAIRQKTIWYGAPNVQWSNHATSVKIATSGGTVFATETTDAGSSTASDVSYPAVISDAIYLLADEYDFAIRGCWINNGTKPASGTVVWEYSSDGSTWTALSGVTAITGNANFTSDSAIGWTLPEDAADITVDSVSGKWVRGRLSVARSTTGNGSEIAVARVGTIFNKTIAVRETVSRTFRSVVVEVGLTMVKPGAASDLFIIEGRLGGSGAWTVLLGSGVSGSDFPTSGAENGGFLLYLDATALFTAGFGSGATQQLEVRASIMHRGALTAAADTVNIWSCCLSITYDSSDDSSDNADQMQTLLIPIDSITGGLTTTAAAIGGSGAIPKLTTSGGILDGLSPTIEDMFLIIDANNDAGGTTDGDWRAQIDSGAEVTIAAINNQNTSDMYTRGIVDVNAMDPTAAHTLNMRVSAGSSGFNNVGALLVVTYRYPEASVTQRIHQEVVPFNIKSAPFAGTASTAAVKATVAVPVQAANPTLIQSGIKIWYHQIGDPGAYNVAIGGQSERSYDSPSSDTGGPRVVVQRLDSGGVAGSGVSFARGMVTVTIASRVTTTPSNGGGESGLLLLAYRYDKESGKRPSCARHLVEAVAHVQTSPETATVGPAIPEASYFLGNIGWTAVWNDGSAVTAVTPVITLDSGNGVYEKPQRLLTDASLAARFAADQIRGAYRQHAADAGADLETSRTWTITTTGAAGRAGMDLWASWHDYSYSISKQVTDSDGGTVNIEVHDALTHELLLETSRVGDGTWTATWWDNAREIYAVAYEDDTHLSRSANFVAGA